VGACIRPKITFCPGSSLVPYAGRARRPRGPGGRAPAAPHAIAATPVWLAAVFAVAGLTVIPLTRAVARARRTTSAG